MKIANIASIVSDMFSATAAVAVVSAINLSNSFTNLMLSKLISRRNNLARLSVLENSAITGCRHKSFKKWPRKKRFWIKPGRSDQNQFPIFLQETSGCAPTKELCQNPILYLRQVFDVYNFVLLEGTRQFFHHPTSNVLKLTKPSWIDKNYACATRFSLPGNRFHTETSGRFALRNLVPEWNSRPGARTAVNSRRGDSRQHDTLWWYHVNKCRALRGNRSELAPERKSSRCHVNTR